MLNIFKFEIRNQFAIRFLLPSEQNMQNMNNVPDIVNYIDTRYIAYSRPYFFQCIMIIIIRSYFYYPFAAVTVN